MSELPPAQFRKTKTDKWAVMAPVETLEAALADGGKVDVLKKSGDWSTFSVGSLGKAFDVDGVQMCYGYSPDDSDADSGGAGSASARSSGQRNAGAERAPAAPGPEQYQDAPARDDEEPLPEYQGGSEDEWNDAF